MKKLNNRQERFCREYAASGNGYQSAKAAGYSENYSLFGVSKLLKNDRVQERLKELYTAQNNELIAKGTELKQRLTQIARGETAEEVVITEGTGEGRSEARLIMKKASVKDQLKAIELLGRMGGMFTANLNIDSDVELNIKVDYGSDGAGE